MNTPFEAVESSLPSTEQEAWRYSPIRELDIGDFSQVVARPEDIALPEVAGLGNDAAALITVVDGHVVRSEVSPGWEGKGLTLRTDASPELELPEAADGFDQLHGLLHRGGVEVIASADADITDPVVIRYLHGSGTAAKSGSSNLLRVVTEEGATVRVLEHHSCQSAGARPDPGSDGQSLSLTRTEFVVGDRSHLIHTVIQDLDHNAWQLSRVLASVGERGLLSSGMAAFGGHYARVRTDVDLVGRGAKGELIGVYFADGEQVLDFRGFQHHRAPDTQTDMLFKGTVDDQAGSIYSGLINIHEDGPGSNADQTNRAVKLSDDAWAWSVPNLEINNSDVRCSHASTVSPVDPDQRFYLHARGVPPAIADRLIVAGFFNEAIDRLPVESARGICRQKISDKLDERIQA